jgi:hypothetical protein
VTDFFNDWDGGDDLDDDGGPVAVGRALAPWPTWIIPPSGWGSAYVDFYATRSPLVTPAPKVIVHHSAGAPPAQNTGAEHQWLRNVEAYGESRDGAKVEYSWVVMPSGRVYAGFGDGRGCHCSAKNPATGQTFNYTSHGICLPGDHYTTGKDTPTPAALSALADLLIFLIGSGRASRDCLELNPSSTGDPTSIPGTFGHWGLAATGCPGDRLFGQLPAVLDAVAAELTHPDPGDEMPDEATFKQWVRDVLNEGTAPGQDSWAGTSVTALQVAQANYNETKVVQAMLNAPSDPPAP